MANYPAPRFDGHSIAFGADGATIVAADDREGIWLADFDLARIRALRRDEPYHTRYQRPDCYRLLGPTGQDRDAKGPQRPNEMPGRQIHPMNDA
jgi:hypothetical protein